MLEAVKKMARMRHMHNKICSTIKSGGMGLFKMRLGNRRVRLTPQEMRDVVLAYNDVMTEGHHETTSERVAEVCRYFGVPCERSGSGWYVGWRDYHPKKQLTHGK